MAEIKTYPVLRKHPELSPIVSDLIWLRRKIKEAVESKDTTPTLCLGLMALQRIVVQAFWQMLYSVSPLSDKQRLELVLDGPEPVVRIHPEGTAGEKGPRTGGERPDGFSFRLPFSLT